MWICLTHRLKFSALAIVARIFIENGVFMIKHVLVLGLLAAVTFPAAAEGVYMYGDAGRSKFSGPVHNQDNALAIGFGYDLNNNLSAELGYHDLGDLTTSEIVYYPGVYGVGMSVNAKVVHLSAIAKLPLSDTFGIYCRLGYARIKNDITATDYAKDTGISTTINDSMSENKVTFGIGGSFKYNEKISLRAEYIKFGDTDISSTTLGARYAF